MKTIVKLAATAINDYRESGNRRPKYVGRDVVLCNPSSTDIDQAAYDMAEEFPDHVVYILSVKEEEGI